MTSPKILVVQLGRIGDFILATAMFRALKIAYPRCEIHVLASRHNATLAVSHPEVARVYVHSKKVFHTLKLLVALKRARYDFWIDPKDHYSREGSFFARMSNAKHKVGFNRNGESGVFDVSLPSEEAQHAHVAWRNLHALRALGVEHTDPRPSLLVHREAAEQLAQFLSAHGITRYFCVNLSAGNEIRYWPITRWRAFLQAMAGEASNFVLTAEARDAPIAEAIAAQVAHAHYFPTRRIVDLLAVVQQAELVISPDTSVIHMAAAFDRPVLGLYSNHEWNYKKFYPLSTHCRIVIPTTPGGLIKDIASESAVQQCHALLTEMRAAQLQRLTAQEHA